MNNYNALLNNLEELELLRIRDNISIYLDSIADGTKTAVDALYELTELEKGFRSEQAIKGCVKVANFPYIKEINQFDFGFQPSIDKAKIMDLATLRFLENNENVIFCGSPGVGKTNLAVAIGIVAAKQRHCVYFITFCNFLQEKFSKIVNVILVYRNITQFITHIRYLLFWVFLLKKYFLPEVL